MVQETQISLYVQGKSTQNYEKNISWFMGQKTTGQEYTKKKKMRRLFEIIFLNAKSWDSIKSSSFFFFPSSINAS